MDRQSELEALARFRSAAYTMRIARRRHRAERNTNARGLSFRAWARRTYNVEGCDGKLALIVAGKTRAA